MSEHVYWQDDSGLYKREGIVRCHDCKYRDTFKTRWSNSPLHECLAEWCEGSEGDHPLVELNGFCAWGERNEKGKGNDGE